MKRHNGFSRRSNDAGSRRSIACFAVAASLVLVAGCGGGGTEPTSLRIGLVPEVNIFHQANRYEPVSEYLEQSVGIGLRFMPFTDYEGVLETLGRGDIDGAVVGSYVGAAAIENFGCVPIARPEWMDGSSTYHGVLFARADIGFAVDATLGERTLALVSRRTTAGYLFPLAHFRDHGVEDLEASFGRVIFAGSHDAAVRAVYEGRADVGCAKDRVFKDLLEQNPAMESDLVVLARSASVPSNGLVVTAGVGEETVRLIEEALTGMDRQPEGRAVLQALGATRFIATTAADYEPVVAMANTAGVTLGAERIRR